MSDAKSKKKKPSFFARMANRGRELKALGQVLANDPRSFPAGLLKLIKRSLRTVWDARGGGLYACGFLVTFVFLEIRMFFVDIYEAESVSGYFSSQMSELLFKYIGESFQNTISAFMWPVYVVEINPTWGAIILAGLFIVFPKFIKGPLEGWLFDDDES
ncbi:MAG: hypothetical protein ACR2Q3_05500 [Woeseiaceae bacterium]